MSENRKELKIDDIVQILLAGGKTKTVVLFNDSVVKRRMGDLIGEKLRKDLNFVTNKVNKYRITNNLISVDDTIVYLGLKKDEPNLLNNYSEQEIVYYAG